MQNAMRSLIWALTALGLLGAALPASAAITETPAQECSGASAGDTATTGTNGTACSTFTSGNLIYVLVSIDRANTTDQSFSCPSGYTAGPKKDDSSGFEANGGVCWKVSDGTETSVSVTLANAPNDFRIDVAEFTFSNTPTLDQSNEDEAEINDTGAGSVTAGSVTTTQADVLLIGGFVHERDSGCSTESVNSSYTIQSNASGDSSAAQGFITTRLVSSTGTYNPTLSCGTGTVRSYGSHMAFYELDSTAPVLSSASATDVTSSTADLNVTTTGLPADGTLYYVSSSSCTSPSATQMKAGQDHTGSAGEASGSQAITTEGAKTFNDVAHSTGTWCTHFFHEDAAGNDSNIPNTGTFVISSPDTEDPVANAGPDQAVGTGVLVTLDGSSSTDNVGVTDYTWTQTAGQTVTLSPNNTVVGPTFTSPTTSLVTITFSLVVEDAAGNTSVADTVDITLSDTTDPVSNAGPDQGSVGTGNLVTLDGSGSTDNIAVTDYTWLQTAGTTVSLSSTTVAGPTFTAPTGTTGTLTFQLTAEDAAGNTNVDTVDITVVDDDDPVTNAGPNQSVGQSVLVTLDGTGSTDNVGVDGYAWLQTAGTSVTLSSSTASQPTFTSPGSDGTLTFQLTVDDAAGNDSVDTVDIIVSAAPTQTVSYDQATYDFGDRVTGSLSNWSSAPTGFTEQAGSDSFSTAGTCNTTTCGFDIPALSEFTSTGSANNTQWEVSLTVEAANGSENATDTLTINAPADSTTSYFTSSLACSKGACPSDSVVEVLNMTGAASGDDLYCRATVGEFTMSTSGVPMFSVYPATLNCRFFDDSGSVWSAEIQEDYSDPDDSCDTVVTDLVRSLVRDIERNLECRY